MVKGKGVVVNLEDGEKIDLDDEYLPRGEAYTKDQINRLIARTYERLKEDLGKLVDPYKKHGEQIDSVRRGFNVLGKLLGVEVPSTVKDEELEQALEKALGYNTLPEALTDFRKRLEKIEGRLPIEDGSQKGKKKKGDDKETSDGYDVKEELESLKRSLEEGGELYNSIMGTAKREAKAVIDNITDRMGIGKAGEKELDSGEEDQLEDNDSSTEVEKLARVVSAIIQEVWTGAEREKYLKMVPEKRQPKKARKRGR